MQTEFRWVNPNSYVVTLMLEPSCETFDLNPADEVVCIIHGPKGEVETVVRDDSITVFGWSGTRTQVLINGRAANPDWERMPRMPSLPPGMSTRSFLSMVLGDERAEP
jgi:hypothetical protein